MEGVKWFLLLLAPVALVVAIYYGSDVKEANSTFCIQMLSDVGNSTKILDLKGHNILALLGNFESDVYERLLQNVSQQYRAVIILAGNKDYYSKQHNIVSKADIDRNIADAVSRYPNVFFLNDSSVVIDNYLIVGSTLWFQSDQLFTQYDQQILIPAGNNGDLRSVSIHDIRIWHTKALQYITDRLDMVEDGQRAIVLTHYAPYVDGSSGKIYDEQGLSKDLSSLLTLNSDVLEFWAHGHSQTCSDRVERGVRIIANCPGVYSVFL